MKYPYFLIALLLFGVNADILAQRPVYNVFDDPMLIDPLLPPPTPNSRFSQRGIFGDQDEILGIDLNATNSRFKPLKFNRRSAPQIAERLDSVPQISVPNFSSLNPLFKSDLAGTQSRVARTPGMLGLQNDEIYQREQLQSTEIDGQKNLVSENWFRDKGNAGTSPAANNGPALPKTFGSSATPNPSASGDQRGLKPPANRAVEEKMEEMLIQSPLVNPLSPIRITISGQTATIRGVVPSQAARTEAGRILLSNPAIRQVNNQLTVVKE